MVSTVTGRAVTRVRSVGALSASAGTASSLMTGCGVGAAGTTSWDAPVAAGPLHVCSTAPLGSSAAGCSSDVTGSGDFRGSRVDPAPAPSVGVATSAALSASSDCSISSTSPVSSVSSVSSVSLASSVSSSGSRVASVSATPAEASAPSLLGLTEGSDESEDGESEDGESEDDDESDGVAAATPGPTARLTAMPIRATPA